MSSTTRIWLQAPGAQLPEGLDVAARVTLDSASPPEAWVPELAANHPGVQIAAAGDLDQLRAAAGWLLGVDGAHIEAHTVTLDWPLDGQGAQMIGIDLDWVPPFQATGRSKFPGGPGVAGSTRA